VYEYMITITTANSFKTSRISLIIILILPVKSLFSGGWDDPGYFSNFVR
jgi:hypothetical protein